MNTKSMSCIKRIIRNAVLAAIMVASCQFAFTSVACTNDLAAEMGIPGEYGHARVAGAYETVIAACHKHNKWPGMGGVDAEELMRKYIEMGMRLVLTGSDGGFLMAAAGQRAARAREWGAKH